MLVTCLQQTCSVLTNVSTPRLRSRSSPLPWTPATSSNRATAVQNPLPPSALARAMRLCDSWTSRVGFVHV
eukprot:530488-Rhodomonas_salina.5